MDRSACNRAIPKLHRRLAEVWGDVLLRLHLCRLVEAADLRAAQELFGTDTPLDKMQPKSLREFESYGRTVALQYLKPHEQAPHYKGLLKALVKSALENLPLQVYHDATNCIRSQPAQHASHLLYCNLSAMETLMSQLAVLLLVTHCLPPSHLMASTACWTFFSYKFPHHSVAA